MTGPVAVIGGGIGGLTTALALTHHGIDCRVYERAPELREIGAGLGLWPGPQQVYERLGLGATVHGLSGRWRTAGLRRRDGRYLVRFTYEDMVTQMGGATIGVHRGELQSLLLSSLPSGVVATGKELSGLDQRGDEVVVTFTDGDAATARAVVGADGLRSRTREILFGARPPRDCRSVAWRGTAPAGLGPRGDWADSASETWGPGGRFGILPLAGRVSWYAAADRFTRGGGKDELLERFGSWHHPIDELVAATEADHIWSDHLQDIRPLRRWSRGRVTLLGDAAHAMTPDLGQGACQAVLDAWALAEALATDQEVPAAFAAYEAARRRPANRVAGIAHRLTLGARSGAAATEVRSRVTALVPPTLALRGLAFVARA